MSSGEKPVQLGFKSYAPKQWPPYLSKMQKKEYEHTRCRGFRPDEIQRLKAFGLIGDKPGVPKGPFVQ